jgi:hypothetical protein
MQKRVAILQSNYIPWKGYFDLMASADEFVLYDHVQYTKNDWRNRNKIKSQQGVIWLTIPVLHKGKFGQRIDQAMTANDIWRKKHWNSLVSSYSRAPYFNDYAAPLKQLYLDEQDRLLSDINYKFLTAICGFLNISTPISYSRQYELPGGSTENLVAICRQLAATEYISGPSAKNYLNPQLFDRHNITVHYADYSNYKHYNQLHPPFDHHVSVLDLLFCEGPNAANFMKFSHDAI